MANAELIHIIWLIFAVALEIVANIFLKLSDGFKRFFYGIVSLICVLGAFSALSQAVKGIDLAVAYALWGAFGIVATMAAGWIMFGQKLKTTGWIGLSLLMLGMVMIKFA